MEERGCGNTGVKLALALDPGGRQETWYVRR